MNVLRILKKVSWVILLIISSCNNGHNLKNKVKNDSTIIQEVKAEFPKFSIESLPDNKKEFKLGESLKLNISVVDSIPFDSIQIFYDNLYQGTEIKLPFQILLKNQKKNPGKQELRLTVYRNGKNTEQTQIFRFLSDIEPKLYSYEVVKVYPHERSAYTQGLVFEDGYFYESNGIKGESTLRKVQIGTGDPIQSFTLAPEIFAEGLSIMEDKIIQLSWQNQTGFVYDKKSFKLLNTFSYTTEGWGLTNDGKNLIMSDGTEIIYFLDSRTYTEVSRIEVYDNKGMVNSLNELEYIDGEIWANIYRTDKIVRIDPSSGKVLAYIDLSKILSPNDYERDTDVLNGIAYDAKSKRLFVTGKKWPKLFEIKLK